MASLDASMVASYRPSAVSRFLVWTAQLPGRGWWVYPALYLGLGVWAHAILWLTGRAPVGSIDPVILVGLVYGPYALGMLAVVNRVASASLATFWPATGWPEDQRAGWAWRFTHTPAGSDWWSLLIGVPLALGSFFAAPVAWLGPEGGRTALLVAYLPALVLGYSTLISAIFLTTHQLRLVARIHREATALDPFDREPVYAFSRLTVVGGLSYVGITYYTVLFNSAFQAGNVLGLAALAAAVAAGIATFVLPLWGIHGRLVRDKAALLREVEVRLTRLSTEMYRRIDANQFEGTKVVSDSVAGVTALRERITRLPTWPWPPQILRGFLTALALPVIVYLVSRALANQIGT